MFRTIKHYTVGELRDFVLSYEGTGPAIQRLATALTGEMVSSVAKLMTNLDLVYAARKINNRATCVTTLGEPGIAATRALPKNPTDDPEGILAATYEALAYGVGDAMLGFNPVEDSIEKTTETLTLLDDVRNRWEIPTQICVLSHITTQMEAIDAALLPI